MPKSVFSRTYRIFLAQLQLTRESTGFAAFLTQAQLPDEFFPRLVLLLAPAFEDGPHGGASIDDHCCATGRLGRVTGQAGARRPGRPGKGNANSSGWAQGQQCRDFGREP